MDREELIEIGYEIMSCNDEGLTDFGEALRIYEERHTSPEQRKELQKAGEKFFTLGDIEVAAAAWQNEFKQIIDMEFYRKFYK